MCNNYFALPALHVHKYFCTPAPNTQKPISVQKGFCTAVVGPYQKSEVQEQPFRGFLHFAFCSFGGDRLLAATIASKLKFLSSTPFCLPRRATSVFGRRFLPFCASPDFPEPNPQMLWKTKISAEHPTMINPQEPSTRQQQPAPSDQATAQPRGGGFGDEIQMPCSI